MTEKRGSDRSTIELAASFGISEKLRSERATVVNISEGGFCFVSDQKIKDGSAFKLSVAIEDGSKLNIDVVCVWSKPGEHPGEYVHGVKIANMMGKDVGKFLDFNSQIFRSGS